MLAQSTHKLTEQYRTLLQRSQLQRCTRARQRKQQIETSSLANAVYPLHSGETVNLRAVDEYN